MSKVVIPKLSIPNNGYYVGEVEFLSIRSVLEKGNYLWILENFLIINNVPSYVEGVCDRIVKILMEEEYIRSSNGIFCEVPDLL